jgi:hypothetical protein
MSLLAIASQPSEIRELADPAEPPRWSPAPFQFSLGTLLVVMTFFAVGTALTTADRGLGAWFFVVVGLTLMRTFVECRRHFSDGQTVLVSRKLLAFAVSFGYTFLAFFSAMIVFSVLSMLGVAIAIMAHLIAAFLGGQTVGMITMASVSFSLMVGAALVAARTFYSLYWQTILPRTTLDPPTPRHPAPQIYAAQ